MPHTPRWLLEPQPLYRIVWMLQVGRRSEGNTSQLGQDLWKKNLRAPHNDFTAVTLRGRSWDPDARDHRCAVVGGRDEQWESGSSPQPHG